MVDWWYFTLAGQTRGPATAVEITNLASAGILGPDEYVWPEGCGVQITVQTFIGLNQAGNLPDWLADVIEAESLRAKTVASAPKESTTTLAPTPKTPDWLDDVRQAEGVAQTLGTATKPELLLDPSKVKKVEKMQS